MKYRMAMATLKQKWFLKNYGFTVSLFVHLRNKSGDHQNHQQSHEILARAFDISLGILQMLAICEGMFQGVVHAIRTHSQLQQNAL
mmetsp:Transcript_5178/g.8017  ORF Transcript_5178/g.8017 Transcript_5178/m.8017 type:complete len:86 (-) Transcript_5178:251-508(-)